VLLLVVGGNDDDFAHAKPAERTGKPEGGLSRLCAAGVFVAQAELDERDGTAGEGVAPAALLDPYSGGFARHRTAQELERKCRDDAGGQSRFLQHRAVTACIQDRVARREVLAKAAVVRRSARAAVDVVHDERAADVAARPAERARSRRPVDVFVVGEVAFVETSHFAKRIGPKKQRAAGKPLDIALSVEA